MEVDASTLGSTSRDVEAKEFVAGEGLKFSWNRPLLRPNQGRGKELCDLLRAELQVPQYVKSFEVRFAMNEVVTVRCEYMPTGPEEQVSE